MENTKIIKTNTKTTLPAWSEASGETSLTRPISLMVYTPTTLQKKTGCSKLLICKWPPPPWMLPISILCTGSPSYHLKINIALLLIIPTYNNNNHNSNNSNNNQKIYNPSQKKKKLNKLLSRIIYPILIYKPNSYMILILFYKDSKKLKLFPFLKKLKKYPIKKSNLIINYY